MKNLVTLEWSKSGKWFNISNLHQTVIENIRGIVNGTDEETIVIGVYSTERAAEDEIERLLNTYPETFIG